jgi:hypothetical protein
MCSSTQPLSFGREPATWRDTPPDHAWRDRADRQKVPVLRQQRLHSLERRSNLASGRGVHPQVTSTSPAYHDLASEPLCLLDD